MDSNSQRKLVVESLKLLAASYEDQKSYLPDFVTVYDEVESMFRDAFLLLPQLVEEELLSKQATASIIRCFNWMELAVRNSVASEPEYFRNHENWQKVRQLASKALADMGEQKSEPDLDYTKWIDMD